MSTPIFIPRLIGGVSELPPSQRSPVFVDEQDNTYIDPGQGFNKRAGSEFIDGENEDGSLNVTSPLNEKQFIWMDRDDGEQFVVIIDPNLADTNDNVIQVFDLEGNQIDVIYDADDPREYLTSGTITPDQRIRGITVADAVFILNREVDTALTGDFITYRANSDDLRKNTNDNNLPSWFDFPQPPTGTVPDGDLEPDINGNVENNNLYYARQDEAGLPQGFYRAISIDEPPWYERLRTEPEFSVVDNNTMPIRMDFDGTGFTARLENYQPRRSGDSLLNPSASFFGNKVSDFLFSQNRLWLVSGEQIVASRSNDLTNFWLNSPAIITDQDFFDIGIAENQVNNIDHLVPFQDRLIAFTRANRQIEIGASGPFSINTISLRPIGDYDVAPYVQPVSMQDRLFFMSEKNFHNTVWTFHIDPETNMPRFDDWSRHAPEYIPATARQLSVSERHRKLFVLTRAEPEKIYINDGGAWYRWIFNEDTEVLSTRSFADHLYMIVRRDDKIWIERIFIGEPDEDTVEDGEEQLRTMGYGVRLDRKQLVQGVYDIQENTTTWTINHEDDKLDTIVLGPLWDTGEVGDPVVVRLAGIILEPDVTISEGQTLLTVEGQWAKNNEGEDSPVYIGRNYNMRVRLAQQFVRSQEGEALFGNTMLLSGRLRFKDTVYFRIEVQHHNRTDANEVEFIFTRANSTPLDADLIQEQGEQFFRILGRNDNVDITIVNDRPVPSLIVDGMINTKFVPQRKTPT